jgi:hypothetical protein
MLGKDVKRPSSFGLLVARAAHRCCSRLWESEYPIVRVIPQLGFNLGARSGVKYLTTGSAPRHREY